MASIEERLNREDWEPVPGDQLVGEITSITVRIGKSEKPYPVLVVKDDDGTEHIVSCAMFAGDVITHRPVVGERVGVKFWGPQPRTDGDGTWDKYTVAFEKERTAEVDWDGMAQARGVKPQTVPAVPAAALADDPWND